MNLGREDFYLNSPILIQNLICCIEGQRIKKERFGVSFTKLFDEYIEKTFWPFEETTDYSNQRLQRFVFHSYHTVPYYKKLFDSLKLCPGDIKSLKDLSVLPILNKITIQENYSNFLSRVIPHIDIISAHTSGSTGAGLKFLTTRKAIQEQWAVWQRYRGWHGIKIGELCGVLGGRSIVPLKQDKPPFWRYNIPGRQILFSGYHMSPDNIKHYIEEISRAKLNWLHGYPSLLSLLASSIIERGIFLKHKLKWITTGAESLLPAQKEIINKAFGLYPIQHYGMAEAVANISECELGRLHIDEDFSAVEFIPNNDGITHKVIGTNFTNPATPMLRYDTGDIVCLSSDACPCGRSGRVVESIDGRIEDFVILGNGSRIGRMDHIFKDMVNIKEAQIYQTKPGEIVLRVVKGGNYNERDEEALFKETIKRVGEETNVIINYVDCIERTKTGKLRFVLSEIDKDI